MTAPTPSLRQLMATYARPVWARIAALCALTFGSSALVAVQPVLIAAILVSVLGDDGGAGDAGLFDLNRVGGRLLAWLGLAHQGSMAAVAILGGLFFAHAVVLACLDYASAVIAQAIRAESARLIQWDLVKHLLPLSLRFFHRERAGEIMSRFSQDALNAGQGLGPVVRGFITYGGQILVYGTYLVSTDVALSLGAAALLGLHLGLSQALRVPLRRRILRTLDAMGDFAATLQELLTTIRVVKSFGAETYEEAKLRAGVDRVKAATIAEGRISRLEPPARAVLDALAVVGILLIGVMRLHQGALTTQGMLMYLFVGRQIIAPVNGIATTYVFAQAMVAAFGRIGDLMQEGGRLSDGPLTKRRFEERIEFREVTFSYDATPVIERVSFTIDKGEVVAVVGPSGAGKSTLGDLLLRLYDPDGGAIVMDGVHIERFRQAEYRRLFGVVPQETLLYHDTVRANIRYGRSAVTDEDIDEAARMAHAHDFITALPDGYDTVVGDRGVRLSGGERQRIAIARAIAHHPEILILDEATSAVDAESERQLQGAIDAILKTSTALMIAHRLSTVLRADRIMVLDRGRVVDIGRHEDLLGRCDLYRRLCELQFLGETAVAGVSR